MTNSDPGSLGRILAASMSDRPEPYEQPHRAEEYEIRVKGHLADRWAGWFDGLSLSRESDGITLLAGSVVDQAALHGLLQRVRDTGLPLVSVTRVAPASSITSRTPPRRAT